MTTPKKKTSYLLPLVTENAREVATVGTFLALLGLILTVFLYLNLRTDIEELLPDTARSVKDLIQVTSRLNSMENIVILVFSKDKVASKKFVEDFSGELEKLSKSLVSRVEYKIDKELKFFKDRQALFMNLSDLILIRDYVKKRIAYEMAVRKKKKIIPPKPELNFDEMKKKYQKKIGGFEHLPGGYYATSDEMVRAIVVYMPGKGLDLAHQLKSAIEATAAKMKPTSYAPDLEVKYTGNIQNLIEESAALVEDLTLSTVIVTLLVVFVMLIFYRSAWATWALVASLFMGTFWTFGLAYLLVGYLNANTAFLASIVIGNGINFGVIFLARYLEERRKGKSNHDALDITIKGTLTATATAALAAGLSYGSLMLTGFKGFSQFGVIGLSGMILCWLSAYTLLPAYLTLIDRNKKYGWFSNHVPKVTIAQIVANRVRSFPGTIVILSLVGVLASAWAIHTKNDDLIETDLSKLRDKRSVQQGSGSLYHYIDDIFGHSVSPMVVLTQEPESAHRIAELFREEQRIQGEKSIITSIQTLDDFLPKDQRKKTLIIGEIKSMITPLLRYLTGDDAKMAAIFTNSVITTPFRLKDLPPLVTVRFRESNGNIGNIVLVDKVVERNGDSASALTYFVTMGRQITDRVENGAPVAGGLPVTFDMYEAIVKDGPRATAFAFLAVVILVVLLFRNLKIIFLTLFALLLGVGWLAGIILGYHLKINFLNFIALPITFGIGVDYGVNIFQRYRQDGDIVEVIKNTGGAVMLASMTTIIGYSSLLFAGNQAFVSFGLLAVFGEITCVLAALVSLPALIMFLKKKRLKV